MPVSAARRVRRALRRGEPLPITGAEREQLLVDAEREQRGQRRVRWVFGLNAVLQSVVGVSRLNDEAWVFGSLQLALGVTMAAFVVFAPRELRRQIAALRAHAVDPGDPAPRADGVDAPEPADQSRTERKDH